MAAERWWFARASATNIIGQAVPLVVALVTVPFVVRRLGAESFGIVALAWTVAGYFALFDLGLGRAVTKLGAESWTSADRGRLHGLVRLAIRTQLAFGVLMTVLLVAGTPWLVDRLQIPERLNAEAVIGFRLLATAIPAILITNTYRGALEALRRFDLVNWLRSSFGSATYALTLLGALLWQGTTGIIALIVLARWAGAAAHLAVYRQVIPVRELPATSKSEQRALLSFGGWVSATSVLVPLTGYLDRFLVGGLVSLAAVAYYAGPYELVSKLLFLPGSIAAVLLPVLSSGAGTMQRAALLAHFRRAAGWSAVVLLPPVTLLLIFAEPVLALWLGADYVANSTTALRLLLMAALLNGIALVPFATLEALGRPDLVTKYHLIELPIYLLLAFIWIREAGINGAAGAWLVRNAWGLLILALLARRALRSSTSSRPPGRS